MFKSALTNVLKNIYIVFVAMGIIYFALIICIASIVFGLANAAADISQVTYAQLRDYIVNYLNAIPISGVFYSDTWSNFFGGIVDILGAEVSNFKGKTIAVILASTGLLSLAFVSARSMCRYLMRRNKFDKNSRRGIFVVIFRFIVSYGITLLTAYLQSVWHLSAFFLLLAMALLFSVESLLCTWFVYFKGYKIKEVLNLSNCVKFIGSNFMTFAVGVLFIVLLFYLTNALIATLIAVPFLIYLISAMDINCIDYLRSKILPEKREKANN